MNKMFLLHSSSYLGSPPYGIPFFSRSSRMGQRYQGGATETGTFNMAHLKAALAHGGATSGVNAIREARDQGRRIAKQVNTWLSDAVEAKNPDAVKLQQETEEAALATT